MFLPVACWVACLLWVARSLVLLWKRKFVGTRACVCEEDVLRNLRLMFVGIG